MTRQVLFAAFVVLLAGQVVAADHVRTIDGTVGHPEEGFLIGNGDLSCSVYQTSDDIVFRLGKGDVWDRRLVYDGVPKPGTLREFLTGALVEGWKSNPFDGNATEATKGTKDEKRMRELCQGTSPVTKEWPYPCPKPTGELRMKLPVDLPGPAKVVQKLYIEDGEIRLRYDWPNGVALGVSAVVAPDSNVLSVRWKLTGWTAEQQYGLEPSTAVWFTLWRWADPTLAEYGAKYYRDSLCDWLTKLPKRNHKLTTLPPPTSSAGNGFGCIEQGFYPDASFPDGFRYRMTLAADPQKVGRIVQLDLGEGSKDACVRLMTHKALQGDVHAGELAVTVMTSRDASLEAPKAPTHAECREAAAKAGAAFWQKSGVRIPSDPFMEDLWYATHHAKRCILKGGTVPPGLFFPSTVGDYSIWHGDYHSNYNVHSIYWGDFAANHAEQALAYFDCADFYAHVGRKIARDYYGGRGMFMQLEGFPVLAPDDYNGMLPLGRMAYMTGWFSSRYLEYYRYTLDRDWLANYGYPFLRDIALFYLDFMKKAPHPDLPPDLNDGKYHLFPSICGETGFTGNPKDLLDGWQVRVHARHALWCAIEGAKALGRDEDLQKQWQERLDNLVGEAPGLDKFARFCSYCYPPEHNAYPEALREDAPEWDGVLPPRGNKDYLHWYLGIIHIGRIGNARSNSCTPELAYALWRRDLAGWTHPNGLVWAMALQNYGRAGAWTESLACVMPFQEMMLQSWDGAIHVFPRWPKSKDASFRDFRAQGAFLVSAEMKGGKVGPVTVKSEKGARCVLAHDRWRIADADGKAVATGRDEFGRLCFQTVPGGVYCLNLKD